MILILENHTFKINSNHVECVKRMQIVCFRPSIVVDRQLQFTDKNVRFFRSGQQLCALFVFLPGPSPFLFTFSDGSWNNSTRYVRRDANAFIDNR